MRARSHSVVVWLGHSSDAVWMALQRFRLDAVAITLRDGRKFALGTDDPHRLTTAIRAEIS